MPYGVGVDRRGTGRGGAAPADPRAPRRRFHVVHIADGGSGRAAALGGAIGAHARHPARPSCWPTRRRSRRDRQPACRAREPTMLAAVAAGKRADPLREAASRSTVDDADAVDRRVPRSRALPSSSAPTTSSTRPGGGRSIICIAGGRKRPRAISVTLGARRPTGAITTSSPSFGARRGSRARRPAPWTDAGGRGVRGPSARAWAWPVHDLPIAARPRADDSIVSCSRARSPPIGYVRRVPARRGFLVQLTP